MVRVRLSVDVEPELKHKLAVLAAIRGVSMSDIVVKAVQNVIDAEGIENLTKEIPALSGALRQYADYNKRALETTAWADRADDLH